MTRKIITFHNKLSDLDLIWFPFIFLRPDKDRKIGQSRILAMTLCFSVYGLIVLTVKNLALDGNLNPLALGQEFLFVAALFFIWFQSVTAPLWNLRAQEVAIHRRDHHA